jgi:site-specific DNA recombinase
MSPPPCLRVALYARVSSQQQADDGTIASQVEALRQRIQRDGQPCASEDCYIDEGYSGDTLLRPALERLRDQAAAGAIDRLYIHNPDRLSRKYAYQVVLLDEFKRTGVEVVFLNQPRGDSPEDMLLLQVQGVIAEFERTKILERSRRGRLHAARQGQVSVLSEAPYGYRYVDKHAGDGQARYDVILEEARVVRQIFAWVAQQRCSLREVCRRLQQQGIASPKGNPCWSAKTVATLLSNPAYKGQAGYGKTHLGERRPRLRPARGQAEQPRRPRSIYRTPEESIAIAVPALVEEPVFAAVAEQLQENRRRQRQRQPSSRYLLAGLTVCKQCGYAYFGMSPGGTSQGQKKRYSYYRCGGGNTSRYGGQRLCHNAQVRGDLLEAAVWQDVCELLRNPEKVEEEYRRRLNSEKEGGSKAEEEQREARQRVLRRGVERLIDAYTEGLLSKEEFEPRIKDMRERLRLLEEESRREQDEERQKKELRLFIGCLEEFGGRVKEGLDEADPGRKREICRRLIKRIEIDNEDVHVVYRVGLPPFEGSPTRGFSQHCGGREPAGGWLHRRAYAAPLA